MKLSGYITTRNCVTMDYPFKESIQSLLDFCDEVVVMDSSDKSEGTIEALSGMEKANAGKLKVYHADLDWKKPNHGIYDGVMKQAAREKCTGDFLFQLDADEVIHKGDRQVLEQLLEQTKNLQQVPLLSLPVVEYWGGPDKVRVDVNPWKWRVSRNHPEITHGIPITHRKVIDGLVYAQPGTDTCDYIGKSQGLTIPNLNFCNSQADTLRAKACQGDPAALEAYEKWFNEMVKGLPTVYHFSWYSIKSKIYKYRDFFGDFWKAMYGDDRQTNVFFDVPWEQVTDEMIEAKAKELRDGTGGWIFHKPWNGSRVPSVKIEKAYPEVMKEWCDRHKI